MAADKPKHGRHLSGGNGSHSSGSAGGRARSAKSFVARCIGVLALVAVVFACAFSAQRMGIVSFTSGAASPESSTKQRVAERGAEVAVGLAKLIGESAQDLPRPSGWVEGPDGSMYYYDEQTHRQAKGWLDLSDGRYYFDEQTGAMHLGWLELDGNRYWLDDGTRASRGTLMTSTWLELDEGEYLLSSEGSALMGWQEVDGQTYCFGDDGAMRTGWADARDGSKRWLKSDGTMATNEWIQMDDGVWQVFDVDGTWVTQDEIIPPNDAEHVEQMSARQYAVVSACDVTPWPGKALCARWVSDVFINAGEGAVGGDACDIANTWCVSFDLSDLRPGMVIAVPSHPRTDNGKIWGHVCIYVGGGYVRDSGTYGVRKVQLSSWFAWFGATNTPRWGWANGVSLA
jgi:hypothetical protein